MPTATGYLASAIVKRLVEDGKNVRITVRRKEAGEALRQALGSSLKGSLDVAVVSDITESGAFKSALQEVTYIFHAASPLPGDGKTDPKRDFLDPALNGTLALLRDAHATPSVKKVVLTASIASIRDRSRTGSTKPFSESDWDPTTYEDAVALSDKMAKATPQEYVGLAMTVYSASKKVAEQAAWDFVEQNKPGFELAAVHPGLVMGSPVLPGLSNTNETVWQCMSRRPLGNEPLAPIGYVDLVDVVEGHLQAMKRDEANGKRFILVGGQPLIHEVINWAKEHRPDLPLEKVDVPADADARKESIVPFDTTASRQVLGIKYKPMQQSVADFADWISGIVEPQ